MCDTIAKNDIWENDLRVVDIHSTIGTDAQCQVVSVDCRDSGVGDIASEDNCTGDGMVCENTCESLDASIGKRGGGRDESLVVRDEDSEIRDALDSVKELGCCESSYCSAHANLLREARKGVGKSGGNDQDLVNLVDGYIVGGFDVLKLLVDQELACVGGQHTA